MISDLMKSKLFSRFDRQKYCKGITWKEIDEYYHISEKDKLFCYYCGKELKDVDVAPYRDIVSVDRIQPFCEGGKNVFDNLAICCVECNIVKGTMSEKTFRDMLTCLTETGIKDRVFKEIFRGRRANMLKRKNKKERRSLFEYM